MENTHGPNALHLRRAANRAVKPNLAPDPLPRINELIRNARASWLGLLSYLAFVGVTLLGVEDADFFIPERQTELPLIGVTIPTPLFFYIAPLLGAMLYANLHLYLLKLWEALSEAPATVNSEALGDRIHPWLVADFALSYRHDASVRNRPLNRIANFVTLLLVFLAAPIVLIGFWWWSMPKHDELLTVVFCGIPAIFTLYVLDTSTLRFGNLARGKTDLSNWRKIASGFFWVVFCIAVSMLGWFRTEGTLADYARNYGYDVTALPSAKKAIEKLIPPRFLKSDFRDQIDEAILESAEKEGASRWWMQTPFPNLLAPAQLAGVSFVDTPSDWLVRDAAEQVFRKDWCKSEGLPPAVCGNGPFVGADPYPYLSHQRQKWCRDTFQSSIENLPAACDWHFADRETRYRAAWDDARATALNSLQPLNLTGADLRGANLAGAPLEAAILSGARLQGADLSEARLEGADLSEARLEGAALGGARLEGAHLFGARLEGAHLNQSRLDGAHLNQSRLDGAYLESARLDGAYLSFARLDGAFLAGARLDWAMLNGAQFSATTNLADSLFPSAWVRDVDFTLVPIAADQLNSMFGDASVILPGGKGPGSLDWPEHWPKRQRVYGDFDSEWRKWRADPAGYNPPE